MTGKELGDEEGLEFKAKSSRLGKRKEKEPSNAEMLRAQRSRGDGEPNLDRVGIFPKRSGQVDRRGWNATYTGENSTP